VNIMAKTVAERQATYKAKRAEMSATRLDVLVSAETKRRLVELGHRWTLPQWQALEQAIAMAYRDAEPMAGRLEAKIMLLNSELLRYGYEKDDLLAEIAELQKQLIGEVAKPRRRRQA
jgi:hypothetical protein